MSFTIWTRQGAESNVMSWRRQSGMGTHFVQGVMRRHVPMYGHEWCKCVWSSWDGRWSCISMFLPRPVSDDQHPTSRAAVLWCSGRLCSAAALTTTVLLGLRVSLSHILSLQAAENHLLPPRTLFPVFPPNPPKHARETASRRSASCPRH